MSVFKTHTTSDVLEDHRDELSVELIRGHAFSKTREAIKELLM